MLKTKGALIFGPVMLSCVLVAGCMFCTGCYFQPTLANPAQEATIDFPRSGTQLFVRGRVWGYTGDHELISVCPDSIAADERTRSDCLLLYTSEIYYEISGDASLKIYAVAGAAPRDHPVKAGLVDLTIVELKTGDEFDRYARNYKADGLSRFTAIE